MSTTPAHPTDDGANETSATRGNPSITVENTTSLSADSAPHFLPVRWGRLAAITIPLIILNTGWIANSEMKTWVTEATVSSLFMGVTFILFVATLVNLAVRRFVSRAAALNQPELMALYTMLSMSSVVAGVGHFGFFLPFLAGPFDPHAPNGDWRQWLYLLPRSIGPRDPAVLLPFFVGHSNFFQARIVHAWIYPLAVWCSFFLVILWTTLCLASVLRRKWEEEEHLPFPIIALPLEMTRDGAPLYANGYLWLGFAIPAILHSLNSLHSLFPPLPSAPINSERDFVTNFALPTPWSGMGTLFYMLHPVGVGFGYIVSTDVSFSLWFFYLLKKIVDVISTALGMRNPAVGWWYADGDGEFPFYNAQGWGAWTVLGALALWMARKDIRAIIERAFDDDRRNPADSNEPMTARTAVFGFAGGFITLCAFIWVLGGSWWLPVAFLGIYILILLTLARLRAETAVVSSELVWVNPQNILTAVVGTNSLSHADLVHTGMLSWFNADYRTPGLSHELEGLVGQHRARGRLSPLVTAIMVAAAVAMIAALVWDLQLYYTYGASSSNVNWWRIQKGMEPWNDIQGWIQNPLPADPHMIGGLLFGAGVTLLLSMLRLRFVGFPFHPAGYALNVTFANDFFWGDMLLAWTIKVLILRYGGMKTYRNSVPFFLGLILGDFVTGSIWSIVGAVFRLDLFRTFPT
jgi:hypothetical protein